MTFSEIKFSDIAEFRYGKMPDKEMLGKGIYPVFSGYRIVGEYPEFNADENLIVVARGVGGTGDVKISPKQCFVTNLSIIVDLKKENVDKKFLYYYFSKGLKQLDSGSAQSQITITDLSSLKISLPDYTLQTAAAKILGDLDRKIELNRRMNETLEQIGQALFKHYFIDNPERENWDKGTLGDIIKNFDSKRIPLSSREREQRKGHYRYIGATSVMDYVDEFIFDGKYLLLAEDGSVINPDSTPVLQYVWGQFWVNNHAHVLQAVEPFTVEYLYLLLRKANVASLVSGAVQLKINQKAMNGFPIVIPPKELIGDFNTVVEPVFSLFRKNVEEITVLESLRDSLLPKLISGQISV